MATSYKWRLDESHCVYITNGEDSPQVIADSEIVDETRIASIVSEMSFDEYNTKFSEMKDVVRNEGYSNKFLDAKYYYDINEGECVIQYGIIGKQGAQGVSGEKGDTGAQGEMGVSVEDIYRSGETLYFKMSDNNIKKVTLKDGKDGKTPYIAHDKIVADLSALTRDIRFKEELDKFEADYKERFSQVENSTEAQIQQVQDNLDNTNNSIDDLNNKIEKIGDSVDVWLSSAQTMFDKIKNELDSISGTTIRSFNEIDDKIKKFDEDITVLSGSVQNVKQEYYSGGTYAPELKEDDGVALMSMDYEEEASTDEIIYSCGINGEKTIDFYKDGLLKLQITPNGVINFNKINFVAEDVCFNSSYNEIEIRNILTNLYQEGNGAENHPDLTVTTVYHDISNNRYYDDIDGDVITGWIIPKKFYNMKYNVFYQVIDGVPYPLSIIL